MNELDYNIKETHTSYILRMIPKAIDILEHIDNAVDVAGLNNEQFVLDFYDRLN